MSRDYAKRIPHTTRRKKERRRRRWTVMLLSMLLLIILSIWFRQCHSRFSVFSVTPPPAPAIDAQFDFYPDGEAQPAAHAPAVSPPMTQKTAVGRYVLRLGTFQSENEATEMRVSLLLEGWDVSVASHTVDGHMQYDVEQGPYENLEQAKAAQKSLQRQGLVSVIKE